MRGMSVEELVKSAEKLREYVRSLLLQALLPFIGTLLSVGWLRELSIPIILGLTLYLYRVIDSLRTRPVVSIRYVHSLKEESRKLLGFFAVVLFLILFAVTYRYVEDIAAAYSHTEELPSYRVIVAIIATATELALYCLMMYPCLLRRLRMMSVWLMIGVKIRAYHLKRKIKW